MSGGVFYYFWVIIGQLTVSLTGHWSSLAYLKSNLRSFVGTVLGLDLNVKVQNLSVISERKLWV